MTTTEFEICDYDKDCSAFADFIGRCIVPLSIISPNIRETPIAQEHSPVLVDQLEMSVDKMFIMENGQVKQEQHSNFKQLIPEKSRSRSYGPHTAFQMKFQLR
jgi:hypothetical protein